MLLRSLGCIKSISPGPALHLHTYHQISIQIIHLSIEVSRCDQIFNQVSRFQYGTKYSLKYQGFNVGPNIHLSMKVSRWDQIFIRVSRFQCGTKYSFKLERRIEGKMEGIIEGIIVGRTIVRVQASEYGCHNDHSPLLAFLSNVSAFQSYVVQNIISLSNL